MPPAVVPRKRTRKRKRRAAVSSSESSSDSDSSSSSNNESTHPSAPKPIVPSESSSSSDSDSDSSDSSSSSAASIPAKTSKSSATEAPKPKTSRQLSPSPSPPPAELPSFLPSKDGVSAGHNVDQESAMKDRFRRFWMASVSDGFKEDLEEIRKEHDLGTTRLGLLIDALASGTEVFTPKRPTDINEMEVVLS